MPNITEFDAGNLAIRPSETGVEAAAAAGRRIGSFYNQVGESLDKAGAEIGSAVKTAEDYIDHQQIRAGAASSVQLFADQLQAKDAAIKSVDINDPHYAEKVEGKIQEWRDQSLNRALDQFRNGFTTQKAQDWADEFINKTRQTMFAHSTADIQDAAAIGFHNSAKTIVNTATNTVFQDPSMLTSQLDIVEHGMTGLIQSSPVKGIQGAKILSEGMEQAKEQMVKSAVQGAIMKGGNWQSIAKQYPEYVNGAEMAQFEKAQRSQDRFNLAQDKAIQLYNKQIENANAAEANRKTWSDNVTYDPATNSVQIKPGFLQGTVENLHNHSGASEAPNIAKTNIDWAEAMNKKNAEGIKVTTDQATYSRLSDMVSNGDPNAENAIRRAEAGFHLDTKEGNLLLNWDKSNKEIGNNPGFSYAKDYAKQIIEGTSPGEKAMAVGKFPAFMQAFTQEYLKERNNGTLKDNALNVNDENSLISQMLKPYDINSNIGSFIKSNGGVGAPAPAPKQPSGGYAIPGQTMNDSDERPVAGKQYAANERQVPQAVEDILNQHASGKATPGQVRAVLDPMGFSVDLRKGNYEYEVYGPDGHHYYVAP